MSSKFTPGVGDWVCSDSRCANVNFARRDKCNKCGKPKKLKSSKNQAREIGKEFAEKSKGLFSPDDWNCKSCGNINWAKRNICNVCNVSRFNTQGQRTGYGGGYMERDLVVEYKEHDSDDEFDEFGLKKKKFRKVQNDNEEDEPKKRNKNTRSPSPQQKNQDSEETDERKVVDNEDDDEDEEESGDEKDLSKYDIWGAESEGEDESTNEKSSRVSESADATENTQKSQEDRSNGGIADLEASGDKRVNDDDSSSADEEDDEESSSDSSSSSSSSSSSASSKPESSNK